MQVQKESGMLLFIQFWKRFTDIDKFSVRQITTSWCKYMGAYLYRITNKNKVFMFSAFIP